MQLPADPGLLTAGERTVKSWADGERPVVAFAVGGNRHGVLRAFGERDTRDYDHGGIVPEHAAAEILQGGIGIRVASGIESTCVEGDAAAICIYTLNCVLT